VRSYSGGLGGSLGSYIAAGAVLHGDIPPLLRCWTWLIPLVWIGVILGQRSLGTSQSTAFPVVIAPGVSGLRRWLWGKARASVEPRSAV
jgi:hypothetical protein